MDENMVVVLVLFLLCYFVWWAKETEYIFGHIVSALGLVLRIIMMELILTMYKYTLTVMPFRDVPRDVRNIARTWHLYLVDHK